VSEFANVELDVLPGYGGNMTGDETKPRPDSALEGRRGQLREVERVTVSILMFDSDGHLLLGKQDPAGKRAHRGVWHLPGGEAEEGEHLTDTATRKMEQTVGLRLAPEQLTAVPFVGEDEQVMTLDTGETVWCQEKLHRFEVRLDKTAAQLEAEVQPGDGLVVLRWFNADELADVELLPSVREFLIHTGHLSARRNNDT